MGKTFTCIMALKKIKEFPVLIICPKIVMQVWYDELIEEGAKPSSIAVVDSPVRQKNLEILHSGKHITLVNFEKVKNYDILKLKPWKVVIIDELDRLANIDSQVTRYFLRNRRPPNQRRWGLSGTPAPETAVNLVTEYLIILGEFMGYPPVYGMPMEGEMLDGYMPKAVLGAKGCGTNRNKRRANHYIRFRFRVVINGVSFLSVPTDTLMMRASLEQEKSGSPFYVITYEYT
jgi:superfamily II DNA or RNA helicase